MWSPLTKLQGSASLLPGLPIESRAPEYINIFLCYHPVSSVIIAGKGQGLGTKMIIDAALGRVDLTSSSPNKGQRTRKRRRRTEQLGGSFVTPQAGWGCAGGNIPDWSIVSCEVTRVLSSSWGIILSTMLSC